MVSLLFDSCERYQYTCYKDKWLSDKGYYLAFPRATAPIPGQALSSYPPNDHHRLLHVHVRHSCAAFYYGPEAALCQNYFPRDD